MTIKQLYEDAIKYEESFLAHYIFYLIRKGKIALNDDVSVLEHHNDYSDEFLQMWQKNQLGFCQIKVYSLKQNDKKFVFIFAENKKEAILHYRLTYSKNPLNCHELSLDNQMVIGHRVMTFRRLKKEFKSFPVVVGEYERTY